MACQPEKETMKQDGTEIDVDSDATWQIASHELRVAVERALPRTDLERLQWQRLQQQQIYSHKGHLSHFPLSC